MVLQGEMDLIDHWSVLSDIDVLGDHVQIGKSPPSVKSELMSWSTEASVDV